ncbi:MAG TPA: CBS domain-containing protein [Minicystis sp.]|nr:CBS domain-containing protein [Minicystis sp.]
MKRSNPTVADYMTKTPHSIGADQPISRARALMREHGVRHLPVLEGGHLVGIVTDRDLAATEAVDEDKREALRVDDAMTPFPYVAAPSAPLAEVARAMAAGKFGAALVADAGRVVGVFTTTDAMRALADALEARPERRQHA